MKPSTYLRIASVAALLLAAGHSMGAPWAPTTGRAAVALVESMKSLHVAVMGSDRTFWDFYFGFGLCICIYMLVQAVALWQVATLARTDAARYRPLMVTLLLSCVANAVVDWMYFFAAPLAMTAFVGAFIALALISAKANAPVPG